MDVDVKYFASNTMTKLDGTRFGELNGEIVQYECNQTDLTIRLWLKNAVTCTLSRVYRGVLVGRAATLLRYQAVHHQVAVNRLAAVHRQGAVAGFSILTIFSVVSAVICCKCK